MRSVVDWNNLSGTTTDGSSSRRTPWLSRVAFGPCNDVVALPDPAHSQDRLGLWEVGMCVKQLMNALV